MEAYVLGVVYHDHSNFLHDAKIRIFDNSPSAKVTLYDYPIDAVVRAMKSGSLAIEGLHFSQSFSKPCAGGLKYFDRLIGSWPSLYEGEKKSSPTEIAIIDSQLSTSNGVESIVVKACDTEGKLLFIRGDKLKNSYHVINIGSYAYAKYSRLLGEYELRKGQVNGVQIGGGTAKSPLFTSWLRRDDYDKAIKAHGLTYKLWRNEFFGMSPDVLIINVPVGLDIISACSDQFNPNEVTDEDKGSKATAIRIPHTVHLLRANCFSGANNIKSLIFENRVAPTEYDRDAIDLAGVNLLVKKGQTPADPKVLAPIDVGEIQHLLSFIPSRFNKSLEVPEPVPVACDLSEFGSLTDLTNCFTFVSLDNGVILPPSAARIKSSFNQITNLANLIIPKSVSQIQDSFNNKDDNTGKSLAGTSIDAVVFPPESQLKYLTNSFCGISAKEVDLSNCNKLDNISLCFCDCPNLERVILPKETRYLLMESSFRNCPRLTTVICSDAVYRIQSNCFENADISVLEISGANKLFSIKLPETEVVIRGENVGAQIVKGSKFKKISFVEPSIKLDTLSFYFTDITNVDFPDVNYVGGQAFSFASGNVLDMYNWSTKHILDGTFKECKIRSVILPKGITTIGDDCFNGSDIQNLFIPNTVTGFETRAFKRATNENRLTTLYISKGNKVLKHIKKKDFLIKEFDSDEEAYQALIDSLGLSSDRDMLKAKLIMGASDNPVLQEIASEKYIGSSKFLYSLYTATTNPIEHDKINVKLDMSKYRLLMKTTDVLRLIEQDGKVEQDGEVSDNPTESLSSQSIPVGFRCMSNIITSATEPSSFLKSIDDLEKIFELARVKNKIRKSTKLSVVLSCDSCSIFSLTVSYDYPSVRNKRLMIIFISLGGKVVYCATRMFNYNSDPHISDPPKIEYFFGFHPTASRGWTEIENADYLLKGVITPGFNWSASGINRMSVNGTVVPPKLTKLIEKGMEKTFCHFASSTLGGDTTTRYFMDLSDGTVFKTLARTNSGGASSRARYCFPYGNGMFNGITVESVYDSLDKSPPELIKILKDSYGEEASKDLFQLCNPNEFRKQRATLNGAYDALEPCYEWQLAAGFNKYGIDELKKLNGKLAELLFKSVFFYKKPNKFSQSSLVGCTKKYGMQLVDGSILVTMPNRSNRISRVAIPGIVPQFISFVVKPNEPLSKNQDTFLSAYPLNSILRILLNSYNTDCTKLGYLSRYQTCNISDISILGDCPMDFNGRTLGYGIAKATGTVYLVAYNRNDAILLFRLKEAKAGAMVEFDVDALNNVRKPRVIGGEAVLSIPLIYTNGVDESYIREAYNRPTAKLYFEQFDGLTNYEVFDTSTELFEKLICKQPKLQN